MGKSTKVFWTCLGSVLAAIIGGICLFMSVGKILMPSVTPLPPPTMALPATADIQSVWVDHNFVMVTEKGMLIHIKFTIHNRKDIECRAIGYFETLDGQRLRDANYRYRTSEGYVAAISDFKPGDTDTTYPDLTLFLPYDELHLTPRSNGHYDLTLHVSIYDMESSTVLATSRATYFEYGP